MKVLEWAYSYGISLCEARWLTEEEKNHYSEFCRDTMMVAIDKSFINLKYVTWNDIPKRDSDGQFNGCGNQVYILTDEEWDYYLALNEKRKAEHEQRKQEKRISYLKDTIRRYERQIVKPATRKEAIVIENRYNDAVNDGGEGFVPYIVNTEEYEYAKKELAELT